jgi:hypothetical protein
MAQKCAICGAEINVFQSQKLTDGNFICRKKCKKLGMKIFDYVHADLPEVLAHNKQVEEGTKIFNDLFIPRMKAKDKTKKLKKFNSHLFVAPDLGLMAIGEPKYKFWIFGKYWPKACVFRTGDLYDYSEVKATRTVDGKPETDTYMHFAFINTPGMSDFLDKCDSDKEVVKYFNSVFKIEKSLKNIGNTWKNQINAVKTSVAAAKSIIKGEEDAEAKAVAAMTSLDVMQYGDRTELNAKADAALAPYRS